MDVLECPSCRLIKPILRRAHPRLFTGSSRLSAPEWNRLAKLPAEQRTPEEDRQMADLLLLLSRDQWSFPALVYTEHIDDLVAHVAQMRFEAQQSLWRAIGQAATHILHEDDFEPLKWPLQSRELPLEYPRATVEGAK